MGDEHDLGSKSLNLTSQKKQRKTLIVAMQARDISPMKYHVKTPPLKTEPDDLDTAVTTVSQS